MQARLNALGVTTPSSFVWFNWRLSLSLKLILKRKLSVLERLPFLKTEKNAKKHYWTGRESFVSWKMLRLLLRERKRRGTSKNCKLLCRSLQKPPSPPPAPIPPVQTQAAVPPPPIAPPVPGPAGTPLEESTNPISKLMKEGGGSSSTVSTPSGTSSSNPWAKPQITPLVSPHPTRSPAAPSSISAKSSYQTAPSSSIDDDTT